MAKLTERDRRELLAIARGEVRPRTRLADPESVEQRLFVKRWRMDPRTKHLPGCAIPNGGKRGKAAAGKLKAEGVERGAPDWVLFAPGRARYGQWAGHSFLALEFKRPGGGVQSADQRRWQRTMEEAGGRYELVDNHGDAWRVVCDYLALDFNL